MDRGIETVPSETMNTLVNWHWPGNVRELENFIERSVILTEGTALRAPLADLQAESPGSGAAEHSLEGAEREHIIRVLRETRGMISGPTGAARRLGLKRTTLQSKMQRLGITRRDYAGPRTRLVRAGACLFQLHLFQLHKEQNEDRPHSNRDGKLHQGRIAHPTSPG